MHKLTRALLSIGLILTMGMGLSACKQQQPTPPPTLVRTMQVIKQDTPVSYEFAGQVEAQQEAQVRAKVTGMIIAKHITGGQQVNAGDPLFTIDARQYDAALLNAQAQLAQSRANQVRAQQDFERYGTLLNKGAVSQQQYDLKKSEYEQLTAQVNAMYALANRAEVDMSETIVRAPISGKLDTKDLNIGTYVVAGNTVLVTVSAADPVNVAFNMSENEYLKLARQPAATLGKNGAEVELVLSDGSLYPTKGKITQTSSVLSQNTGALMMKAAFNNPQGLLVPGMFARIKTPGEFRQNALLVPQKAIQEQLDKKFISVVNAEGKVEMRPITVGPRVGNLWVIESGLTENDIVIVEGFQKSPPGSTVNAKPITLEELYPSKK